MEALIEVAHEFKNKKLRDKLACTARYIDDYNNIIEYPAVLHPSRKFVIIPSLFRLYIRPTVFNDGLKNIVYIPSRQHNLHYGMVRGAAEGIRQKAVYRLKYLRHILSLEVESESCIDWNLLKSEISEDFSADSHNVAQSKILDSLVDKGASRLIFMFVLVFFFGFAMGMIGNTLGLLFLSWWW